MTDIVPDWASQNTANVPPATPTIAPSWATAQGGAPAWATENPPSYDNSGAGKNIIERLGHVAHGAFMGSVMNGFGGLVARKGFEWSSYGIDKLKAAIPGQTDEWYKQKQHELINQTVQQERQKYADEVQLNQNPSQHLNQREGDNHVFNPVGFASGVVGAADPSYFINPGSAMTGGLAKRVAINTATHAALGSVDDAAYQTADILDGLQKDFDVKRNLESAAMMGAFGAAHPVVSDFVSGLFKARGTDTKPSDSPLGTTSPLTSTKIDLSPEDHAQYQELLNTGNEQEIKHFFDGRNGPKPDWDDVHKWVTYRDGVPEGFAQDEYKPTLEHDDTKQAIYDHIDKQTSEWQNRPDIEVINHVDEIQDPQVRETVRQELADISEHSPNSQPLGFLGDDGKVRLFAKNIDSPETLNAVLFHESLGHYGLAQKFGDRLDAVLGTLIKRNVGQFGKDVATWQKENPGAYGGNKLRAAEEVLANMSQDGVIKPSVSDAVVSHVRSFGRKMGLKLSYSDAEVRNILAMAHNAVVNGKGRNVAANGFRFARAANDGGLSAETIAAATKHRIRASELDRQAEVAHGEEPGWHDLLSQDRDWHLNRAQEIEQGAANKFMRTSDLKPKDVAEEAYERLAKDYVPTPRSMTEAKAAAEDRAIDPGALRKMKSVGNIDIMLHIYNNAANEANSKLLNFAEKREKGELTDQDRADLLETKANFDYVLGRLEKDPTQIARALATMKVISFSRNNLMRLKKALGESGTDLEGLADPDNMDKFLIQYKALASSNSNPKGAAELLKGVGKPYWEQYLLTWHQNMMLSGLSTHLKSPMSMATMIGREALEHALSMGLGTHPTEVMAHVWGATRALLDASTYKDTADAFVHGKPLMNYGNPSTPRIPVVSKVTDLISAQDTFFRAVMMNKNLYTLGARKAYEEMKRSGIGANGAPGAKSVKVNWDDVMTAGAAYAHSPTKDMIEQATDMTNQAMLLNTSPINKVIDKTKAYTSNMGFWHRVGTFGANFLLPFIRVQSNNLLNGFIRRSPLALIPGVDAVTRADLAAGGPRRNIALSRIALGTALIGAAWMAADPKTKNTTGEGPESPAKRAELEASGWRPNAIHENGRYNTMSDLNISLNPFDKHNATAVMVAGLRDAYETGKADAKSTTTGLAMALGSILHDFASQTFVNDLQPAFDAFEAKGATAPQKIGQFLGDEAKTMMPNLTTQTAKMVDPNQHDTTGSGSIVDRVMGAVQAATPGASKGLPIRYNVYGQPYKTGTSLTGVHTWVDQGNGQQETTDPTEKELNRLANLTKAAIVTPVQKTINYQGAKIKLDASQFEDYQKFAGQAIVETVRDQMKSGEWQKLSDQDKVYEIRSVQTQAKSEVRDALLQKEGWLKKNQLEDLRIQINGQ